MNPLELLVAGDEKQISAENYITLTDNLNRIHLDIGENTQQSFLLEGKLNWTLRKPKKKKVNKKVQRGITKMKNVVSAFKSDTDLKMLEKR